MTRRRRKRRKPPAAEAEGARVGRCRRRPQRRSSMTLTAATTIPSRQT
jgi:hypothetical protein